MARKTEFTPMNEAVRSGKITPEDRGNDLREALFFDIMRCLQEDRRTGAGLHGLEPEVGMPR
ncbi:MAG: hypothetical protein ACOX2W_10345 [Desulfomonilia bacterium]